MTADPIEHSDPIPFDALKKKSQQVLPMERDGLGWRWEASPEGQGLVFHADRIAPYFGNDLMAEIVVSINEQHLHSANYVITRSEGREKLYKAIVNGPVYKEWRKTSDSKLAAFVEQFCTAVQMKQRSRIELNFTRPTPKKRLLYLVDQIVIESSRPNLLFAPGGSGKSYFVLAMCIAMMVKRGIGDLTVKDGIVPAYFDWEDDFDTFNDRANTVARGFGVDVPLIPHLKMHGGTISDQINDMAKHIQDLGANFGVIDSMSAAAGSVGAGQNWDAIAQKVFDSLAMIPNMTWLIIGHVTKEFLKEPSGSMIGSIQIMNRSGNAREIRSEQEPDSSVVHLKLYDAKWNHTGKRGTVGIKMEFDDDAVTFESESAETIPANLVSKMIRELMGGQALSTAELAKRLGVGAGSIRTAKSRNADKFTDQGRGLIALSPTFDGTAEDVPITGSAVPYDEPIPIREAAETDLPW